MAKTLLLTGLLSLPVVTLAKPANYLEQCWARQGAGLGPGYAALSYREQAHELEHSQYPWQPTTYAKRGRAWVSGAGFLRQDTLVQGAKTYYSKTQVSADELLLLDYGDQEPAKVVTPAQRTAQLLASARYSPVLLLQLLRQQKAAVQVSEAAGGAVQHQLRLPTTIVRLFIRKGDKLVERAEVLSHDDLFGDVLTTYTYRDYTRFGSFRYAKTVSIDKINGKLHDTVTVSAVALTAEAPVLLQKPAGYQVRAEAGTPPKLTVQHYRPNLHFLELRHTDDRVLLVEFRDFLVVAEAPLSPENGELIIREAQKIAPGKPIRYFVLGHYHPHYLGGVRAFVQQGATVLCGPGDEAYVRYLAQAPRTLQPDSLQRRPRPLQVQEITASQIITDGQFSMQIHFIGSQSAHTNDYLIYYFPTEKLLFEDDLVWIKRDGVPRKPSARQAGLYQAIKDRNLPVETVVQSWPVAESGVKTIIPFSDLEQAMQVK
ncbi:hypothetical protein LGH70_05565 [Hymenobacter sp. BT635]|uniref:Metallo-beta-lactamase domain-containing protein n=1 Tax=Hymenobacter nitidus TaxID=2880929 RepID=A0ABS8A9Z6_9BACT|nr:hypothetical protein [Hymenobacter nitidus]MCB2377039.1 hypothetical protein [Hymenobacter nitidus]